MNKRIRQLWEDNDSITVVWPETGSPVRVSAALLEKFAELIVRECTKVIVHGGYWSGGPLGPKRQCTPPEIAQMIKEHFGVEE